VQLFESDLSFRTGSTKPALKTELPAPDFIEKTAFHETFETVFPQAVPLRNRRFPIPRHLFA
jgi:hypothetical protein